MVWNEDMVWNECKNVGKKLCSIRLVCVSSRLHGYPME